MSVLTTNQIKCLPNPHRSLKVDPMASVRAPQYYRWAKDKPVTTNQTYGFYMQVSHPLQSLYRVVLASVKFVSHQQ